MSVNVGTATGYLDLDITGFVSKLKTAQTEALVATNSMSKQISGALNGVGGALEKTGQKMTRMITVPVLGAGAAIIKASIDYESAFAGVRKTVDATEQEYQVLSKGIRELSKELPASASAIAEVTEAAGQLGIKNENLLDFTKTMIDLGESTNMTATQGATQLARFANIANMSQGDFDRLGSVIVDLGNNFATTEAEIVDLAMNLAGAGTQVGLTEAEIMALATTLSSVGVHSAAGGTSFSRLMIRMHAAAEVGREANEVIDSTGYSLREMQMMSSHAGAEFGDLAESMGYTREELDNFVDSSATLQAFSDVTGLTAEKFQKAFKEDAAGALQMFIEGLQDTSASGKTALEILDNMGITEVRLRDSILRAAGAGDLLNDTLDTARNAWEENNALIIEAGRRYETTKAQLSMMKNTLVDAGMTIGEQFLPKVVEIAKKIGELASKFAALDDGTKNTIVKFSLIAAAIGPVLMIVGKTMKSFSALSTTVSLLGKWIANTNILLAAKGTSLMGVIGPVLKVVGVIGLLVGAFVTLLKNNEGFRNRIIEGWDKIKQFFSDFVSGLQERFGSLQEVFTSVTTAISNIWNTFTQLLMPVFDIAWAAIVNTIGVALDVILGIVDIFTGIFTGNWQLVWDGVKGIFEGVWNGIEGFVTDIISLIGEYFGTFIDNIITWFSELPVKISEFIDDILTKVSEWGSNMWEKAKETGRNFIDGFVEFFQDLPAKIGYYIGYALGTIARWGIDTWNSAKKTGRNFINGVIEFVRTLPARVSEWTSTTLRNISAWSTNTWNKAKETGKNFVDGAIEFIRTLPERVKSWLTTAINNVTNFGKDMSKKGKEAGKNLVDAVVDFVKTLPDKMLQFGKDVVNGFLNGIKSLGTWLRNQVSSFFGGIVNGAKAALGIASPSKVFAEIGRWSAEGVGVGFEKQMPKVSSDIEGAINDEINSMDVDSVNVDVMSETKSYTDRLQSIFSVFESWMLDTERNILSSIQKVIEGLGNIFQQANELKSFQMALDTSGMTSLLSQRPMLAGYEFSNNKEPLVGLQANAQQSTEQVIDYELLAETMVDVFRKSNIKVDAYLSTRKVTDEINEENARRGGRRI